MCSFAIVICILNKSLLNTKISDLYDIQTGFICSSRTTYYSGSKQWCIMHNNPVIKLIRQSVTNWCLYDDNENKKPKLEVYVNNLGLFEI